MLNETAGHGQYTSFGAPQHRQSSVSRARSGNESAGALAHRLSLLGNKGTPQIRADCSPSNLTAMKWRPARLGQHVLITQSPVRRGIDDQEVSVHAYGKSPLARPEPIGARGHLAVHPGDVLVGQVPPGCGVQQ